MQPQHISQSISTMEQCTDFLTILIAAPTPIVRGSLPESDEHTEHITPPLEATPEEVAAEPVSTSDADDTVQDVAATARLETSTTLPMPSESAEHISMDDLTKSLSL